MAATTSTGHVATSAGQEGAEPSGPETSTPRTFLSKGVLLMDTLGTKQLEMFMRVLENRAEFAESAYAAGLFDQLGQVVEDSRTHAYN
jgi:hypothetical protein